MNHSTAIRRILGVLLLVTAISLLAVGETLLKGRLGPIATLIYWSACLAATCGAIVCALADARHALSQSRRERRTLLEETLRKIDNERTQGRKGAARPPTESR